MNLRGHHSPHALRHSLTTGLVEENVLISAISGILGHSNTKTAETYLTVSETHLKEFSLDVPDVMITRKGLLTSMDHFQK